ISGLEATRQIRAMPGKTKSRVPIIAITGNVTQDDIEACRKAGMNDFVGKPIDPDYLRSAIMRVKRSGENVIGDIDDPNIAIYLEPHTLTHLQRNFQPNVLKNLIDQFKTKSAEVIGELDAFVANEDRKAIKSKAHMLKGMSRNLALDLMGQLCADIEINALEGDLDEIGDMVSMLQPTLEESSQALGVWYDAVVEGG
ncbi:MAG: response regulator, partial [Pseudomonadota bacterium]|nr:response regulator [Pseudomonadota bacterium]